MAVESEIVRNLEIEVEEKWATIVLDLDREEYNDNHRETRRHCSLDALNLDDGLLPSDMDVFEAVADAEGKRNLYQAIEKLSPQQKELIGRIYFQGEHPADIARELGVSKTAIHNRMQRIFCQLQKNLPDRG